MVEINENGSTHKDNQYHGRDHVNALRDYLEHFARVDSQIGVLFMINGKVAGMECFGRAEVLKARFMKMIESYAETAIDRFDPKINLRSSKAEAISFLQMAKESRVQTKPPVKLETGCRLQAKRCTGFEIAKEDQVVHLSVAAKN